MDNYKKLKDKITLIFYDIIEKKEKTIEDLEHTSIAIAETDSSMYKERKKLIYKNDLFYAMLNDLNAKSAVLSELLDFAHNIEIETTTNKN